MQIPVIEAPLLARERPQPRRDPTACPWSRARQALGTGERVCTSLGVRLGQVWRCPPLGANGGGQRPLRATLSLNLRERKSPQCVISWEGAQKAQASRAVCQDGPTPGTGCPGKPLRPRGSLCPAPVVPKLGAHCHVTSSDMCCASLQQHHRDAGVPAQPPAWRFSGGHIWWSQLGQCYWPPVGSAQGCCCTPHVAQDVPRAL